LFKICGDFKQVLKYFSMLSYKMTKNSSNSSIEVLEGNTKTPKPKQDSPKANWSLTLNNWTELQYNSLMSFFSSNSSTIWIIGKEVGENGTPHLQIYFCYKPKIRFTGIKKICNELHIEASKGTKEDNLKYCAKGQQSKEEWDSFKANGPNWGLNADYKSNTRIPQPLKLIKDLYPWQLEVEKYALSEPDDRSVLFVSGEFASGKTQLAKYLVNKYDFISGPLEGGLRHILCVVADDKDKETWIINLTGKESNQLSGGDTIDLWTALEKIKDGFFMSHFGTKGTFPVSFNSPNVIVFSNSSQEELEYSAEIHNFHKERLKFINI
jgi:hypothetical protein